MAMDCNVKSAYKDWTDEERKELNFWLLNRYASSVAGNRDAQEWAVVATNEYYNKNWNVLEPRHPQLQWQLLCATHNAQAQPRRHVWMGLKQKGSDNKTMKWLLDQFPNMKKDEVELLATISTKKELQEYATDLGLEKKDVKL